MSPEGRASELRMAVNAYLLACERMAVAATAVVSEDGREALSKVFVSLPPGQAVLMEGMIVLAEQGAVAELEGLLDNAIAESRPQTPAFQDNRDDS